MEIPFLDLKRQYDLIKEEINNAISAVIADASFVRGKFVEEFESNFASYCCAKHCIAVGNGTDALYIALKVIGIKTGDEVIVPANTFIATSEAVSMTGGKVIFADCDPYTYNIDITKLEKLITKKTIAIIPVHLYGQPANLPVIKSLAEKYSLKIIQDCAQSHGAKIHSTPLVEYGDILCFSFYPGKNLGAYGDAGAIITNDDGFAVRAKMFADHGRGSKYDHLFEGINSRMDGIQGAILNTKLKYLPVCTKKRQEIAALYNSELQGCNSLTIPYVNPGFEHVYHLYVIRIDRERDALQLFLKNKGISTAIHYPIALPYLEAYKKLKYKVSDCPVAFSYQKNILSIPIFPELLPQEIEYLLSNIKIFFKKNI